MSNRLQKFTAQARHFTKRAVKRALFFFPDMMTHQPLVPPRGLMNVGDGNYERVGNEFLQHFTQLADLRPGHSVLDVGCGIGRMALPLTRYLGTSGAYEGFDIDKPGVNWCQKNITSQFPNFHFQLSDIFNLHYNPNGKTLASEYKFPYADNAFDLVFLTSVFTHLLPKDLENYFREIIRVTRPGGHTLITWFLLTEESRRMTDAPTRAMNFPFTENTYACAKRDDKEAAIAYEQNYVERLYEEHGLHIQRPVRYGSWSGRKTFLSFQDIVIAQKLDDRL